MRKYIASFIIFLVILLIGIVIINSQKTTEEQLESSKFFNILEAPLYIIDMPITFIAEYAFDEWYKSHFCGYYRGLGTYYKGKGFNKDISNLLTPSDVCLTLFLKSKKQTGNISQFHF